MQLLIQLVNNPDWHIDYDNRDQARRIRIHADSQLFKIYHATFCKPDSHDITNLHRVDESELDDGAPPPCTLPQTTIETLQGGNG